MAHQPNILIVEDDHIANIIYRELFKRYECGVDIVESAELALEKFNQEDYDLLLVDIRLPKMDGFEFTKHIRSTKIGKTIPIIGMSAVIFSLIEDEFKASGMDHYLDKPFPMPELDALLQSYGIPLRKTAYDFATCEIYHVKNA